MAALRELLKSDLRRQARVYVNGLLSSTKHYPRFVIYCRGRDGSTLLVNLLNQLPEVHCDEEILLAPVIAPRLYVRCTESTAHGHGAYGFKLLSHHLTHVQKVRSPAAFMRHLDCAGYKIIHLRRENLLRQVLSNFYVRHRGGYADGYHHHNSAEGTPEVTQMTVNLEELDYWLRENERRAQAEETTVNGLRSLDLTYERDLQRGESHQDTVDRVAEYLGVGSTVVKPRLARLTTDDLAEFVSNHDEVVTFLQQTPYRRFLPVP